MRGKLHVSFLRCFFPKSWSLGINFSPTHYLKGSYGTYVYTVILSGKYLTGDFREESQPQSVKPFRWLHLSCFTKSGGKRSCLFNNIHEHVLNMRW